MRLIASDDVRLALYEQGDPANPTVVLLHGYPDDHRVWDQVADLLRGRFHVVRYDVRGAGRSSAPRAARDYRLDRLAADMDAVLDAVGKPKVHLAAHDWGSIQGWYFTGRSDRFASFTSLGGPGLDQAAAFFRQAGPIRALGQLLRSWYIGAFQLPVLPELAMAPLARALGATAADARNGLNLYRANMLTRLRRPGDPHVNVPVQLIECTRDRYVSPWLLASLGQWAPKFRHRRLAADHWAQRTQPEAVAKLVAEFADWAADE
ncbi:alpha/beta fold hydrolase [Nonomuraea africana]|uniref:Pimeloyl-ACP methyl ester carboxylesterase n=1 Tax=Nonomuraea africana TaxID=46171 RepID=A0ABR9KS58_9ACTN|nr:alpha/beta fold hydrolase [Nonomuraea africana]MBE1564869.1 pimeloyl-ACP methyl ester carboxylesterase [Nonomuraea africana]